MSVRRSATPVATRSDGMRPAATSAALTPEITGASTLTARVSGPRGTPCSSTQ